MLHRSIINFLLRQRALARARLLRTIIPSRFRENALLCPPSTFARSAISAAKYDLPGASANLFALIMVIATSLLPVLDRSRPAFERSQTIILDLHIDAVTRARADGTATEYPEFAESGLLRDGYTEADLVSTQNPA